MDEEYSPEILTEQLTVCRLWNKNRGDIISHAILIENLSNF